MQSVSASDLVRRFGEWQERALASPVYIQHHGRPRLVLASLEFMQELARGNGDGAVGSEVTQRLLELVDAAVLLVDEKGRIGAASTAATRLLGRAVAPGASLADALPQAIRPVMLRAVDQVREHGTAEALQLRLSANGERRVDVAIRPFASGVAIAATDRSETDARIEGAAVWDAVSETFDLIGTVAVLRINLRGYIVTATPSFEALTGLTPDAYRSVRVVTLFDIGTRMAVGDAIEAAIERLTPQRVPARMTVNRGGMIDVQVAISAETLRCSVDTVVMTVFAALPDALQ
jgi:PAS domain-containing protein